MHSVVPSSVSLVREPLSLALEPWRAALAIGTEPGTFALLGSWTRGASAVVGGAPLTATSVGENPAEVFGALAVLPEVHGDAPAEAVGGGWIATLGYPLGRPLEPVGGPPPRPVPRPAATLAFHDHVVRCDAEGRWWAEALVADGDRHDARGRLADLVARLRDAAVLEPGAVRTDAWTATPDPGAHAAAVDACVERIAAGDLFQANLCLRLSSALREGDLLDVFVAAWRRLRPAKAAFVRDADGRGAVASLSPELFLRRVGRHVRSSPIKGTRPRGADAHADAEAEAELLGAEKDRAEHVMIVDLVRNDLGRVCRAGTVVVPSLAEPREAPGVWHLVSDVDGELRDDVDDAELLRATFPPGSVTGAPKVAAMRVIHELESTGREAYTGAIGIVSPLAGLDLNVAIRTFEERDGALWLGAGGGIVADSSGVDEAREAADKAAPLLAVVGAAPPRPAGSGPVLRPARTGPVPLPRPDPAAGVFETLLVRDGSAAQLDAHLGRLSASVAALWGRALPVGEVMAAVRIAAHAAGPGAHRVRVDVRPDGPRLLVGAVHGPLPVSGEGDVVLRPVVVPGGLGPHKWSDRRLWDALAAEEPGTLPLLVDLDGSVLETARANVVAVRADGTRVTPALDGRILPGTTRADLVRLWRAGGARVQERVVRLDELREAETILLTGALRGVERARLAPGPWHVDPA